MGLFETLYEKNYKKLLLLPLLLLVLSLVILGLNYKNEGYFIDKDVSLKGGVSITIEKPGLNLKETEAFLEKTYDDFSVRKLTDFSTRQDLGLIVEVPDIQQEDLKKTLREFIEFNENEISVEETGARFGKSFNKDLIIAVVFAFLFMAIVVLIAFRNFLPSMAVILTALIDLLFTLSIISLFNIKLSAAGIIAFLLVIGYSIDSDILLTTKVLKRRELGPLLERVKSSMKTGLTMTVTTIVALLVALIVTNNPVLRQMFLIIVIALFTDVITTYFGNAPLLIWYSKRKGIL